jgi:FkbM family methyltransferase
MLLIKSRIKNSLRQLFSPIVYTGQSTSSFIEKYGPDKIKYFVSVGSNDGVKNDPIYPFLKNNNWSGIMIEPLPENFKILYQNFAGNDKIKLLNIAINEKDGFMPFYFVKEVLDDEPNWYGQVASFDYNTFIKNIEVIPELMLRIGTVSIEGKTFSSLIDIESESKIDLLMIDTEGYDWRILKTFPFELQNPNIIIFEYQWISAYEFKEATKHLIHLGYKVYYNNEDCIAIKKN